MYMVEYIKVNGKVFTFTVRDITVLSDMIVSLTGQITMGKIIYFNVEVCNENNS